MRFWQIILVVIFLSGLPGLIMSLPDAGKAEEAPQEITVADLASHGAGKNIYVQISDFEFGSRAVTETSSGKSEFSKVMLPVFPKGKADDAQASVVVTVIPRVKTSQELKEYCKRKDLKGVVRDNARAHAVRETVAKTLPGLNTTSAPVVFLDPIINPAALFWLSIGATFIPAYLLIVFRYRVPIGRFMNALAGRPVPALPQSEKVDPSRVIRNSLLLNLVMMLFSILGGIWYATSVLDAAKRNEDVWIFSGILAAIPFFFVYGLMEIISIKVPMKKEKKDKITFVVSIVGVICFYLWLESELAKYGFK